MSLTGARRGGKNAVWKLMVDFEMHSEEPTLGVELKRVIVHRQHCTLGPVPSGKNPQCSVNFTDLIGEPNHAVKRPMTYLPNAEDRAVTTSTIAAASPAHHVSLSPASHIAETAGNKIEVIIVPPVLTPIDAAPHAAARTKKRRKKTTPVAAPAAATDDASTATSTPSTAPTAKKGKTTGKNKKSSEPINLRMSPMWVSTTNLSMHCVVAIAHEQKGVAGNTKTITGNVANEPTYDRQWYQKGPSGERIAPGNPNFADMSPLAAFVHMMLPEQLDLVLELTIERLAAKKKKELTHQELLRWIGVCMLIASINFRSKRRKLWEGGGAASKYLPSYDLCVMGMLRNCFDDIWYAVRWSSQPPEQPNGMSAERYCWMLINNFVANINKYRQRTFVPGSHLELIDNNDNEGIRLTQATVEQEAGAVAGAAAASTPTVRRTLRLKHSNGGHHAKGRCSAKGCTKHSIYVCSMCTHATDATQKQFWFCNHTTVEGSDCFAKHIAWHREKENGGGGGN